MWGAFKSFQIILFTILLVGAMHELAVADEEDATVTTDSGSYTVPVEVEDGAVTQVHWPNGGDMNVDGGDISDGEASGTNSRGDAVNISLDDSTDNSEDNGREGDE